MLRAVALGFAMLCWASIFGSAHAVESQIVEVPALSPSLQGTATIPSRLWLPEANASRRPAVVLMHGCAGLQPLGGDVHFTMWARWYVERGFVVLVMDSHGARGIDDACTLSSAKGLHEQRRLDPYSGLEYLIAEGYADPGKVIVQGHSLGGGTVLDVLARNSPGPHRFAGGIAYYPWCDTGPYSANAPLLVLIGGADDWTPAARCKAMVRRSGSTAWPISLFVYPGAYHSFDRDLPPTRTRWGHVVGRNEDAFQDSLVRVNEFLRRCAPTHAKQHEHALEFGQPTTR